MKKIPAISIVLKNHSILCTSMDEYKKVKSHLIKTHREIVLESLIITNQAETLEELANN
ncbi:MAG: hypothetical protein ACYC5G_04100 [Candidatus Doudnabacteria bacterium]